MKPDLPYSDEIIQIGEDPSFEASIGGVGTGVRIPEMPEDTSEEEIYDAAKKYVNAYAGKRTVAALYGTRGSRQLSVMRDCIYTLSREFYNNH